MGSNTWMVYAWTKKERGSVYVLVYSGELLLKALAAARKAKKAGCGCVKIEWR